MAFRARNVFGTFEKRAPAGACFSEVPRTFRARKAIVKLQSACFEKLIFQHVFNVRKSKWFAKFDGLKSRRYEDIKGIVAPEIGQKSFGNFEKQAQALPVRPNRR